MVVRADEMQSDKQQIKSYSSQVDSQKLYSDPSWRWYCPSLWSVQRYER